VVHRPAPNDRVQLADETPGRCALVVLDDASDLPQHRLDTLGRRLDEQLAVVCADMLPEKVQSIRNVRDHRLLRREMEATLLQVHLDQRFDFFLQEFLRRSRNDEVIGQADAVDLWTGPLALSPDVARKRGAQDELQAHPRLDLR
jgi:hypothetical protein